MMCGGLWVLEDTKEVEYLLFGDLPLGLAEELVMLQKFSDAAHFGPFGRVVVRVSLSVCPC